jgi:cysteine dioxygenase
MHHTVTPGGRLPGLTLTAGRRRRSGPFRGRRRRVPLCLLTRTGGSMANDTQHAALSLEEFLVLMSAPAADKLTHEQFMEYGQRLALPDELLSAHTRFAAHEYARNLLCRTPRFELLVLCWRPGQHSTIHDHGGSLNAIKVRHGELTSRLYAPTRGTPPQADGPVRLVEQQTAGAGAMAGIGREGIHQLANETGGDLVTVHLYAPPLMHLTVYSEHEPGTELRPLRYTLSEDMD